MPILASNNRIYRAFEKRTKSVNNGFQSRSALIDLATC
jgi:hypothetical protein